MPRWETRTIRSHPVDVYACDHCGAVFAEEDWHVPLQFPRAGCCWNCGGLRQGGRCVDCGLSEHEDRQVHDELRQLIHPEADLLTAGRLAAEGGRQLLALKLATAATHEGARPDDARELRIRLLMALGALEPAALDAKAWTHDAGAGSPVAWTLAGETLMAVGRGSEAVDRFQRALEIAPHLHATRARMAQCLLGMQRFAMAREEAVRVIAGAPDTPSAAHCRELLGVYVRRLIDQRDAAAVHDVLQELGDQVDRSALLLCAKAWLAYHAGDPDEVRRALKLARKLAPELPQIKEFEDALLPRKKTWWSWS